VKNLFPGFLLHREALVAAIIDRHLLHCNDIRWRMKHSEAIDERHNTLSRGEGPLCAHRGGLGTATSAKFGMQLGKQDSLLTPEKVCNSTLIGSYLPVFHIRPAFCGPPFHREKVCLFA